MRQKWACLPQLTLQEEEEERRHDEGYWLFCTVYGIVIGQHPLSEN